MTYNRVIRHISRLKLVLGRRSIRLSIAKRVVCARNATKVDSEIAGGADDAPVFVLGDADLAGPDVAAGDLESVVGALEGDDLLLANGGD